MPSIFLCQNFDFSPGAYAITGYREEVIDFSEPFANAVNIVMLKKPSGTSKALLYLKPLRYEVKYFVDSTLFVFEMTSLSGVKINPLLLLSKISAGPLWSSLQVKPL